MWIQDETGKYINTNNIIDIYTGLDGKIRYSTACGRDVLCSCVSKEVAEEKLKVIMKNITSGENYIYKITK